MAQMAQPRSEFGPTWPALVQTWSRHTVCRRVRLHNLERSATGLPAPQPVELHHPHRSDTETCPASACAIRVDRAAACDARADFTLQAYACSIHVIRIDIARILTKDDLILDS